MGHLACVPPHCHTCLQAVAPTDTLRVLFINRHYEEGRNILNQPKLAHLME